ncbi:SDR family oxidoreductase [Acidocella sp.]|jgi:2-keto-3-deoxy-L-fuconate dehydrogenase|uniref:SDR family oxidoreductase n=1 Tax=Acidocella sp. TaxID=50710 RepID=UPI002F3EB336
MTDRLAGKKVLITAAAQGIGRACAEMFAREGAHVFATDIDDARLKGLAGCELLHLDVTRPEDIQALAKKLGTIDVLLNGAGYVHHGTILECDDAAWDFSVALNVTAMFRMIRTFLPGMLNQKRGSIINIASVASSVKGLPVRCAYGATKAAVIGLTKSVAADYVGAGIRCNAICPGTVETPSLQQRISAQATDQRSEAEVRAAFTARQPMGRLGTATEIAALATYLASDESAFTTGTVQIIDGGLSN